MKSLVLTLLTVLLCLPVQATENECSHLIRSKEVVAKLAPIAEVPEEVRAFFSFVDWGLDNAVFFVGDWYSWLRNEIVTDRLMKVQNYPRSIRFKGAWGAALRSLYESLAEEAILAVGSESKLDQVLGKLSGADAPSVEVLVQDLRTTNTALKWRQVGSYLYQLEQAILQGEYVATTLQEYVANPKARKRKPQNLNPALQENGVIAQAAIELAFNGKRTLKQIELAYFNVRLAQEDFLAQAKQKRLTVSSGTELLLPSTSLRTFTTTERVPEPLSERGRLYSVDDGNELFFEDQSTIWKFRKTKNGEWRTTLTIPTRETRQLSAKTKLIAQRMNNTVTTRPVVKTFTAIRNLLPDGSFILRESVTDDSMPKDTNYLITKAGKRIPTPGIDVSYVTLWSRDGRYLIYQEKESGRSSNRTRNYMIWDRKNGTRKDLGYIRAGTSVYDTRNETFLDQIPAVQFRDHFFQYIPGPGGSWWIGKGESRWVDCHMCNQVGLTFWGNPYLMFHWLSPEPTRFVEFSSDGIYLASVSASAGLTVLDLRTWTTMASIPIDLDSVVGLSWAPTGHVLTLLGVGGSVQTLEVPKPGRSRFLLPEQLEESGEFERFEEAVEAR